MFRKLSKKFINDGDEKDDPIMLNTDESTQASLRLMDEIRKSRLFTMPTTGDFMKLTQRNTNLCVAIAAMRLLGFALHAFLGDLTRFKQNVNEEKRQLILEEIINLPEVDKIKGSHKRIVVWYFSDIDTCLIITTSWYPSSQYLG